MYFSDSDNDNDIDENMIKYVGMLDTALANIDHNNSAHCAIDCPESYLEPIREVRDLMVISYGKCSRCDQLFSKIGCNKISECIGCFDRYCVQCATKQQCTDCSKVMCKPHASKCEKCPKYSRYRCWWCSIKHHDVHQDT